MGTEHTPGPWHFEQPWSGFSAIRGRNGELVFGIAAGSRDEKQPDNVCEANARLIAAAPEMLEALRNLVLTIRHLRPDFHPLMGPKEWNDIGAAENAIAKAEGVSAKKLEETEGRDA